MWIHRYILVDNYIYIYIYIYIIHLAKMRYKRRGCTDKDSLYSNHVYENLFINQCNHYGCLKWEKKLQL